MSCTFPLLPFISYEETTAILWWRYRINYVLSCLFIETLLWYGISFTIIYQTHISDCLVYNKWTIQDMSQQARWNERNISSDKKHYKNTTNTQVLHIVNWCKVSKNLYILKLQNLYVSKNLLYSTKKLHMLNAIIMILVGIPIHPIDIIQQSQHQCITVC